MDAVLSLCFHRNLAGVFEQERVSYSELYELRDATDLLNTEYNSHIVTEFPFNGIGILVQVNRVMAMRGGALDCRCNMRQNKRPPRSSNCFNGLISPKYMVA